MKLYEDVGVLAVLALKVAFIGGLAILIILLGMTFTVIQVIHFIKDYSGKINKQIRRYYHELRKIYF